MSEVATANSDLLTKAEAAQVMRVAPITVHRMIRDKRLGSYRIGARVFTSHRFIEDYLSRHARRATEAVV